MKTFTLTSEQFIDRPLEEVFPFFADAANLEAITPPWLRFEIATDGPIEMAAGVHIDYRLKLRGIPLRWRSLISAWEPPHRFVDEQVRGPYRLWHHEHTFEERDGGTVVRDVIRYDVPGGELIDRLMVRRDVERIFAYRREALARHFGDAATAAA